MPESDDATGPPPPAEVINLAYAGAVAAALIFFPSAYIAWKHGKAGMVCWPIFVTAALSKLVQDVYLIVTKDQPLKVTAVAKMTNASILACISLTLIGVVYEIHKILPARPKARSAKIILGITHLANTGGIGLATYAGTSKPHEDGGGGDPHSSQDADDRLNPKLDQIGNLMQLFVLFTVCVWMWQPTWRKVQQQQQHHHPNARAARHLLRTGVAAMPFWLLRIGYTSAYAFRHGTRALDPFTGSFAVRLALVFGTWLGASLVLVAGGLAGVPRVKNAGGADAAVEYLGGEEEGGGGGWRGRRRRSGDENGLTAAAAARGGDDVEMDSRAAKTESMTVTLKKVFSRG